MSRLIALLPLAVLAAGCGRSLHNITITNTGDVPTLYEYRDGSGAWQPMPAPDANGNSTIHVTDDYVVLALCAAVV